MRFNEKIESNINLFKEHLLEQFMLHVIFLTMYESEEKNLYLPFKDYLGYKCICF